jgi:MFS family permease
MKEAGLKDTYIIGIYIFYNAVYALLAYPVGILADKMGVKKIFISGLLVFVIVYTGFALNHNLYVFLGLFVLYGLYAAATEGISKAWISNIVPRTETATAIGSYSGLQSLAALLASSVCGLIWYKFGAISSFLFTAIVALLAALYLARFAIYRKAA